MPRNTPEQGKRPNHSTLCWRLARLAGPEPVLLPQGRVEPELGMGRAAETGVGQCWATACACVPGGPQPGLGPAGFPIVVTASRGTHTYLVPGAVIISFRASVAVPVLLPFLWMKRQMGPLLLP